MYQIFEIDPCDGVERLSLPEREIPLDTMFALLGTSRAATRDTPKLDLLVWVDVDGLDGGRDANAHACATLREVFDTPVAAVGGPLLITGGSWKRPSALDEAQAAEAFAYLFGAPSGPPDRTWTR
jgi:hypothetical protein